MTWKVWCPEIGAKCTNGHNPIMGKDDEEPIRCAKWFKMVGLNPQTGKEIDEYKCLEHWKLIVAAEGNKDVRQAAASTDKVATEVRKHHASFLAVLSQESKTRLLDADPQMKLEQK